MYNTVMHICHIFIVSRCVCMCVCAGVCVHWPPKAITTAHVNFTHPNQSVSFYIKHSLAIDKTNEGMSTCLYWQSAWSTFTNCFEPWTCIWFIMITFYMYHSIFCVMLHRLYWSQLLQFLSCQNLKYQMSHHQTGNSLLIHPPSLPLICKYMYCSYSNVDMCIEWGMKGIFNSLR